jgi:ribosomal protein S18 acetylase RimI-like enzyme
LELNPDPPFQIADATWHDFNAVRQLEQICFPQDAWPFWDIFGALTLPQTVRLKAVANGGLVGFIAMDIRQRKKESWIMTVGVLPEYRHQGVASALIARAEMETGMKVIRLQVRVSNVAALRLYQQLGYVEYDRWSRYYSGGEDAILMEKRLQ